MQAHQAYVAQAATAPPKRAAGTIAMPALYRAALGPLNADRYLAFFQRQDDTGRNLPGWNAAAAFFTLGWMVFRQLWMPALVYVAALEGVALLAFALGQHWLSLPQQVLGGVALAVFGAACVLPGLYGDAVMHAEMRKKINRALAASPNLAKAAELLARQAPTRRRLAWVVAVHVLLAAAIVALWLAFPGGTLNAPPGTADASAATAPGAPAAPARPAASATAAEAAPAASAATATASEPESGTAAGTQTPASEPAAAASTPAAPAPAPTTAASAPAAPAPATAARATAAVAATSTASTASAPQTAARTPSPAVADQQGASTKRPAASSAAAPAEPPAAKASAPTASAPAAPTATSAAAPRAHHASRPRTAARAPRPSTPAATAEASATPPAPVQRRLYINVGLFGDPANARRAMALLQTVDLTGSQAQVRAAGGRMLTRVRVGPFTSASEANDAARRVLSLGLEAAPAQN